jgi:hypothetical protein
VKYERNQEFDRMQSGSGWDDVRTANELAIHKSVVWKYRKRETEPSLKVLRLFSGLTGIPLTLPGEEPVRFHDGPRWLEEWESDAILTLRRIEPKQRRKVIEALRSIMEALGPRPRYSVPRKQRVSQSDGSDMMLGAAELVRHFAGDLMGDAAEPPPAGGGVGQRDPASPDRPPQKQPVAPRRKPDPAGKPRGPSSSDVPS